MGVAGGVGGGVLRVWGKGQCIGQRILVGRQEGKKPRGIYNFRRVNNIKINLIEIASESVDWINVIKDGLL